MSRMRSAMLLRSRTRLRRAPLTLIEGPPTGKIPSPFNAGDVMIAQRMRLSLDQAASTAFSFQTITVNARRRTFDLGGADRLAIKRGIAHGADDRIRVAKRAHRVQTGEK